jgi:hypothetical protein
MVTVYTMRHNSIAARTMGHQLWLFSLLFRFFIVAVDNTAVTLAVLLSTATFCRHYSSGQHCSHTSCTAVHCHVLPSLQQCILQTSPHPGKLTFRTASIHFVFTVYCTVRVAAEFTVGMKWLNKIIIIQVLVNPSGILFQTRLKRFWYNITPEIFTKNLQSVKMSVPL